MENKKLQKILLGALIVFILVIIIGVPIGKKLKIKWYTDNIQAGKLYAKQGALLESVNSFSKSLKLYKDSEEAKEYLECVYEFIKVESLYNNCKYSDVIYNLEIQKSERYNELFRDKSNELIKSSKEQLNLTKEVANIKDNIQSLVANKKYDQTIKSLEEYKKMAVDAKYKQYIDELGERLADANNKYLEKKKLEGEPLSESKNSFPLNRESAKTLLLEKEFTPQQTVSIVGGDSITEVNGDRYLVFISSTLKNPTTRSVAQHQWAVNINTGEIRMFKYWDEFPID